MNAVRGIPEDKAAGSTVLRPIRYAELDLVLIDSRRHGIALCIPYVPEVTKTSDFTDQDRIGESVGTYSSALDQVVQTPFLSLRPG